MITEVLDCLTPEKMRVLVCAQKYSDKCSDTEKWYGAKYKSEKMTKAMIDTFTSCSLNENFKLPDINSFIPSNLSIERRDVYPVNHPTIIQEDAMGRLWFKQDDEFLFPKNYINILFISPIAYSDPHHVNLNYMFASIFMDELNE